MSPLAESPPQTRSTVAAMLAEPFQRRAVLAAAIGFGLALLIRPDALVPCLVGFCASVLVLVLPLRAGGERAASGRGSTREVPGARPGGQLRAAVDALREPAFLIDRAMILRHNNPASLLAFGKVAINEPVSLRFRSPDFLAAVEAALRQDEAAEAAYEERRPFDRIWQAEITPIRVEGAGAGGPAFFLLLFRDRTVERRLERMRSDFVANASHELRTPLASLIGFIETLQGPARGDEAARERFLGIMREQARRMSRLIDDLLSLSRIEMKRHFAPSAHIDLRDVFEDVRGEMELMAEENGLEIRFERPEEPFIVLGEEDELIQVFNNLVENACKYAGGGGRIDLELSAVTEAGRRFVDAGVRDHGAGIAPEHVPRLTERFYRVDVASSRSKRGTGLGLSIVRNLLLHHRARLIITSELGRGSVFRARFPMADAADEVK